MVGSLIGEGKPTEALAFAERAKARVLLDVIQNGRISIDASMSDKEQAEERRLYGELVSINARLRAERMAQPPDASRTTELENNSKMHGTHTKHFRQPFTQHTQN